MPGLRSLPRTRCGGIQKPLNSLDSGFRRNDVKKFWTFYETTKAKNVRFSQLTKCQAYTILLAFYKAQIH